ncbi:MAG: hypothetical protein DI585_05325 [Pseudomonas fluorescens]|nr:MAG: hypothetical protein DI585_05325 [Pseudomonas fluorescens]
MDNRELAEDTDAEPVDPVDSIATANAISFDAIAAHIETLPKPYGQDDRKALVARRRAFGAKVQLWLRTAQISQAQAAQQLGFVNRGVFNNLIGGLKPWRAATLKDLSILLNKSAEDMRKAAKMKRNT